jgi:hypothetical protein
MHDALLASGGFVGGFLACWFLAADIKNDILKLRTDLQLFLQNTAKKI